MSSGYRAAVRLDIEVVRLRHQPRDDNADCRVCAEPYPCGPAQLADRTLDAFDDRGVTPGPTVAGTESERNR
jgi:hypothetical protein